MIEPNNTQNFITMLFFYSKDMKVSSRCCVFKVREYSLGVCLTYFYEKISIRCLICHLLKIKTSLL